MGAEGLEGIVDGEELLLERIGEGAFRQRDAAFRLTALRLGERGEERLGRRLQDLRQVALVLAGTLRRERPIGVARQALDLSGGDLRAEEERRDVLDLMRLVEDDRVVVGQDLPAVGSAHRQVGEEEVVVHDHDLRGLRAPPHLGHEALFVMRAARADASVRARLHEAPDRRALLESGEVGAVAALGRGAPALEHGELPPEGAGGPGRAAAELFVAPDAEVVPQALHRRRVHRVAQVRLEEWEVPLHDLVLQRASAGRDDDLLPAQQRRHQIGERLAGARAGFDQEHAAMLERVLHGVRHRALTGAMFVAREGASEWPSRAQSIGGAHGAFIRANPAAAKRLCPATVQ